MTQLADNAQRIRTVKPVFGSLPAAPEWLESLRAAGQKQFDAVGYPVDEKLEAWRWTNIRPIVEVAWRPGVIDVESSRAMVSKFGFAKDCAAEVVLSNGHYVGELSSTSNLPAGLTVQPLADACKGPHAELIRQHLAVRAAATRTPFAALNQAHLNGGVFVYVRRGTAIEKPVHILCVGTPDEVESVAYPRILVIAEDNAQLTLVEDYVGPASGKYLTNGVTEIVAGQDCVIDRYKLNTESVGAFHVSLTDVIIGKNSQFIDYNATTGSAITRNDISVRLNGPHSYSVLNGLTLIGGTQHVDNHTLLEHAYPDCPSYELYKHVLDGNASGIFKGQIYVHPEAQKTDAKQNSKTLILSDNAQMNSQPALEIYADDVKCTHGSTTGPIDDSLVFYLMTRGLSLQQAKQLLIYAFAADVTRRIKVDAVRDRLESFMAAQQGLPQDFRIQELGSHDDEVVY